MWITVENINRDKNVSQPELIRWLKYSDKEYLMTKEDVDVLNNLPDRIQIYRGVSNVSNEKISKGLSWTLNLETAKWFANRWNRTGDTKGYIQTSTVNKQDILAYFVSRGEDGVVVDGRKLDITMIEDC